MTKVKKLKSPKRKFALCYFNLKLVFWILGNLLELSLQRGQPDESGATESIERTLSHETESKSSTDETEGLTDQHQFTAKVNQSCQQLVSNAPAHQLSVSKDEAANKEKFLFTRPAAFESSKKKLLFLENHPVSAGFKGGAGGHGPRPCSYSSQKGPRNT